MTREELKRKRRTETLRIFRNSIGRLEIQQDKLFRRACKKLKVNGDSVQGTYLFDFLFNGFCGFNDTIAKVEKYLWPATAAVKPSETKAVQS